MNKYYFVSYYNHYDTGGNGANTILKNIHPVIWAATHPYKFSSPVIIHLCFWAEIDEAIALNPDVAKAFGLTEG